MFQKIVAIEPTGLIPSAVDALNNYAREVILYDDIPESDRGDHHSSAMPMRCYLVLPPGLEKLRWSNVPMLNILACATRSIRRKVPM